MQVLLTISLDFLTKKDTIKEPELREILQYNYRKKSFFPSEAEKFMVAAENKSQLSGSFSASMSERIICHESCMDSAFRARRSAAKRGDFEDARRLEDEPAANDDGSG